METFELIAPCHFGLESMTKREITDLGYEITEVEDGKVTFEGDAEAIAYANVWLRTTERILLKTGRFTAETYDELFEKTKAIPWEKYIPKDGKFWVAKANSIKSKLFSPSDIQSIMKKAIVERLKAMYHLDWFPEDGESYPIRVSILKDVVTIGLDTTGTSLHKRGYRQLTAKAPITETLAAALLMLTPWRGNRILVDPFCGSGTFPIEAAMIASDRAPGLHRHFLAEKWENLVPSEIWEDVKEEAKERFNPDVETNIQGYDIDPEVVRNARENAKAAGVDHLIHFQQRSVADLSHPGSYGFIVTNPPYGERLEEEKTLKELYHTLGERYALLDTWSMYVISGYMDAERYIGRKADKNRKIYNGMLKTYFYMYQGPKPPKRRMPAKDVAD
ncbi:MAG: class I SAM-dependent RNA methyltransferase [Eubacterium sp.]|nr:class I SAM-dependent RNA methyltransferase [Eubacterium sp.]